MYRAIDAGVFDEPKRLELVHGEIWEKEVVNPPHSLITEVIARLLRALLEPMFWVREEKPLHITLDSEPLPDVAVITAAARTEMPARHPNATEAQLVIEVADATLARDTNEKARLYARAGIADYWVVDVNGATLLVFRDPVAANGDDATYQAQTRLVAGDVIAPLCAPDAIIAVADLLPRPIEQTESEQAQ